jgi:hypothetical protein
MFMVFRDSVTVGKNLFLIRSAFWCSATHGFAAAWASESLLVHQFGSPAAKLSGHAAHGQPETSALKEH